MSRALHGTQSAPILPARYSLPCSSSSSCSTLSTMCIAFHGLACGQNVLKWQGLQQTHRPVFSTGRRQDAHRVAHGGLDAHRQGHRALPALAHSRFLPQVIVFSQLHNVQSMCKLVHALDHECMQQALRQGQVAWQQSMDYSNRAGCAGRRTAAPWWASTASRAPSTPPSSCSVAPGARATACRTTWWALGARDGTVGLLSFAVHSCS